MPLFLQALPLSLKAFWRYLLALPFLGVVALVLSLFSLIPVLGYVVPGVVHAFCIMTGLRCALAARGHNPDADFGQTLRQGLIFSLMTMVATFVIKAVSALLPMGVFSALGWLDTLGDNDPRILVMAGSMFGLYTLFMLIWSAALAVPMTAAVADGGAKGTGINPLRGLGTGLIALTLINLVWLIGGNLFSIFGEIATLFMLIIEALRALASGEAPVWAVSLNPLTLMGGTVFMIWASSWFFSAAILYWERNAARSKAAATARVDAARVSPTDLRALREARMPGRRTD